MLWLAYAPVGAAAPQPALSMTSTRAVALIVTADVEVGAAVVGGVAAELAG